MNIVKKLLTVSSNNKTMAENSPKVYEAGKISALKVPASSNSGILTDCLEAPLISLYAEVVNEYSRKIVLTSETGETQNVIIDLYGNVYTIELRSDGTVWFEENIGSGIIDFVDYTNTEVGQALKALHSYEGTTYVSGANSVGYYKDIRLTQYEAGKKEEKEKIDYHLKRSKKAVLMRGGEIDMNAEIDALPEAISNIPVDASLGFYEDNEIAYEKIVPEGAEEYALLKQLGGMTYKCTNLFDASKIKASNIEVSDNGKTIKMPIGTSGNGYTETRTTLAELCPSLKVDDTAILDFTYTGANTVRAIYLDGANFAWGKGTRLIITQEHLDSKVIMYGNNAGAGDTEQVIITDFRINLGTEVRPFEPYYEGLRDTKVTEIVSHGANIFNPDEIIKAQYPQYINTTFQDNVFTTNFSNSALFVNATKTVIFPKGTYTLTINSTSGVMSLTVYLYPKSNLNTIKESKVFVDFTTATFTFTIDEACALCFGGYTGHYGTYSYRVKLQRSDTATEYTPYREPISYPIPEAVQALEGYGWGVNDEIYNYIDYVTKTFHKKVGMVDLGTLTYSRYSEYTYFGNLATAYQGNFTAINAICDKFGVYAANYTPSDSNSVSASSTSQIKVRLAGSSGFASVKEMLPYVQGVMLYYELPEEEITDISDILIDDNFLSVEGGGTLEFVNEHKNAVPSTIKYIAKVGA